MFPEIEPYESGYLDVGDGNRVYWEQSGNPKGKPALVLHGGPGSGCSVNDRRTFDPELYRVVIFDQRNCGRSLPHASEPDIDLTHNTTHHLVADIELLRERLGIEKWLLRGGSWGATLALVYAERYPERVSEIILLSATTGRRLETDLLTVGLSRMFPEAWDRLRGFADEHGETGPILDACNHLLFSEFREEAASLWCDWEMAMLPTAAKRFPRFESPEFRLAFARLVTHYWRNGSWLEEGEVLAKAGRLAGIPGAILQGRLDLGNLSGTPWELAAAWPGSELLFIEDSGHEGNRTFGDVLLEYTQKFAHQHSA